MSATFTANRNRYRRQPTVGQVIDYRTGPAVVLEVRDHGRQLLVRDALERTWHAERAAQGTWYLADLPQPGDFVRCHRPWTFAGRQMLGQSGRVVEVQPLPHGIVEGDAIVTVALYEGTYTDGSEAFSSPIPFAADDLTLADRYTVPGSLGKLTRDQVSRRLALSGQPA